MLIEPLDRASRWPEAIDEPPPTATRAERRRFAAIARSKKHPMWVMRRDPISVKAGREVIS